MTHRDLHSRTFDEATITKLEIFENYAKEWIPTFVMSRFVKEIWIFDFFAGTGYDLNGIAGSPIRILQQIEESCKQFLLDNPELERAGLKIDYSNADFAEIFPKAIKTIRKYPSLVYLDQNGMKFLSDKYFLETENYDNSLLFNLV